MRSTLALLGILSVPPVVALDATAEPETQRDALSEKASYIVSVAPEALLNEISTTRGRGHTYECRPSLSLCDSLRT